MNFKIVVHKKKKLKQKIKQKYKQWLKKHIHKLIAIFNCEALTLF